MALSNLYLKKIGHYYMITFKEATTSDIEAIREIAAATWPSTYYPLIGKEQVDFMLEKMYSRGTLLEQFSEGCTFLIAELAGAPVGFASFSNINPENSIFKLHKLYVLPDQHGKGVGKILLNEVIAQSLHKGAQTLELNVNKRNKALAFYEHCGFTMKEAVKIDIGNGFFMDDYVLEMDLISRQIN